MPGGFHPFHAGHYALYKSAIQAFPDADVYVAATNDQSERPFPFEIKEKLAKLAGVAPGRFVQVKSPFQAKEITQSYDPNSDVLIFVRSEKDKNESPKPGGTKKDGSPAYFQPYTGKDMQPFSKHAYFAYLPTVKFGPGIQSATEIRKAWPTLDDRRKTAMVMSLYPATQKNPKLAQNVVQLLDVGMGGQLNEFSQGDFNGGDDETPGSWEDFIKAFDPEIRKMGFGMDKRSLHDARIYAHPTAEKGVMVRQHPEKDNVYFKLFHFFNNGEDKAGLADLSQNGAASVLVKVEDFLNGGQGVAEGAPIVVAQAPIDVRNPKKAPQPYRNQGDIVPDTKPPSTEKRGVKGRPGQRPMPDHSISESTDSEDYLEEK